MNDITKKKRAFEVIISVDEKRLCSERIDIDDTFLLNDAIEREFDWLRESGIYFEKIKEIPVKA